MRTLQVITDEERFLLWTMVHTALADGEVSPVEQAFIENLMKAMTITAEDRHLVRSILNGTATPPPVPDRLYTPDYQRQAEIFREAVELAWADGVFDDREKAVIVRLVAVLDLDHEDAERIWRMTRAKYVA